MTFLSFWRALSVCCTVAYAVMAFRAGTRGHTFILGLDCMTAGMWAFAALVSHQGVKVQRQRRRNH